MCLPGGDVSSKSDGTKGNQKVVNLHIRDKGQELGCQSERRTEGLDPDLRSSESSDNIKKNNHQDTLHWSREGAQVQSSSVIFLPCAEVKVSEGYGEEKRRVSERSNFGLNGCRSDEFSRLRDIDSGLTQKVRENGPPALVQLQGIRGEDDFELYLSKTGARDACVSGFADLHRLSQEGGASFAANLKFFWGKGKPKNARAGQSVFFPSPRAYPTCCSHLPKC